MVLFALGNPTNEYKLTRHNVGQLFVDWLGGNEIWEENKNLGVKILKHSFVSHADRIVVDLVKPNLYMNENGIAISKYLNFYKISSTDKLIVIFDDLDLQLGNWKVQREKGPKVHNGILSVEESLGSKDFLRIRIGIYNSQTRVMDESVKIPGQDYVLQKFAEDELKVLYDTVFPQIKESLSLIIENK